MLSPSPVILMLSAAKRKNPCINRIIKPREGFFVAFGSSE